MKKTASVLLKKMVLPNALVGVSHIAESLHMLETSVVLTETEKTTLAAITNEGRKKEWLSARLLLQELLTNPSVTIVYHANGKPYLTNTPNQVSISHTKNFVAVIVADGETGIDIQRIDPKLERIAHKFMGAMEINSIEKENRIEQLCVYWCAKEALCKLCGNTKLEFKSDLVIAPFNYLGHGKIKGSIINKGVRKEYDLCYEKIANDTMLVYVLTN